MIHRPLILYIPGLMPKPDAETHRDALLRCLLTGVRRIQPEAADAIGGPPGRFDIVVLAFDLFREHPGFSVGGASGTDVIWEAGGPPAGVYECLFFTIGGAGE